MRALIVGAVVQAAGGAWATLPDAYVSRLPMWVPFAVSGAIFAFGLWAAYTHQSALEE